MAAATISADPLGTWARTFLRKWTRQRWTAAPAMTALTAWAEAEVGGNDLHPR
jgi:hypothetical protein